MSFLQENATTDDSAVAVADASGLWQTHVEISGGADDTELELGQNVAVSNGTDDTEFGEAPTETADTGFEGLETDTEADMGDSAAKVCGKAGVNFHAGATILSFGLPVQMDIDTKMLKDELLSSIGGMPDRAVAEVARQLARHSSIPALGDAVSSFQDAMNSVKKTMVGIIPDIKLAFGQPKELYKTPDLCVNLWKDTLPKGQTCGSYNIGC